MDSGKVKATVVKMPLATNARAKMDGFSDGFVKLFARPNSGAVLGGVIVAPRASDLILSVSLAVERQITVDEVAQTFAVYPSLTGSITEAARRLMEPRGVRSKTGQCAGRPRSGSSGASSPCWRSRVALMSSA